MDRSKIIICLFLGIFLVLYPAPYSKISAQTCNPKNLKPVRYGQKGKIVKNVQLCLIEIRYSIPSKALGYYESQTKKVVKKFYKDYLDMSWHGNNLGQKGIEELKTQIYFYREGKDSYKIGHIRYLENLLAAYYAKLGYFPDKPDKSPWQNLRNAFKNAGLDLELPTPELGEYEYFPCKDNEAKESFNHVILRTKLQQSQEENPELYDAFSYDFIELPSGWTCLGWYGDCLKKNKNYCDGL
jgi:hypothetical protein